MATASRPATVSHATRSALITGASSGIGMELAKLFARDGYRLVLVARRQGKLDALAEHIRGAYGVAPRVLSADLSDTNAPDQIFAELQSEATPIDVLVNNAGFGELERFAESDLERQTNMIRVNVTSLTHLSRLFLPGMIERQRGGLLNIASTAAFQPGPNMAVYYATKAYVLSFTEALAEELAGSRVRVTCLAPGATETEFGDKSGMTKSKLFKFAKPMSARQVARAGFRGFQRRQTLVVPGLRNKVGAFSVRLMPRVVVRKFVKSLQKAPSSKADDSKPEANSSAA